MALDPSRMRLGAMRAEIPCPACGTAVPVRRVDAYRAVDGGVIWVIASYADTDEEAGAPHRRRRRFPRLPRR